MKLLALHLSVRVQDVPVENLLRTVSFIHSPTGFVSFILYGILTKWDLTVTSASTVTISGIIGTGEPQWVALYYVNTDEQSAPSH